MLKMICLTYRKIRSGPDVQRTNISGLVSASELRWFWISWQNSRLWYGKGNQRGENVIGWYNDPESVIVYYMWVCSYGDNSGFWSLPAVYYLGMYETGQTDRQTDVTVRITSRIHDK